MAARRGVRRCRCGNGGGRRSSSRGTKSGRDVGAWVVSEASRISVRVCVCVCVLCCFLSLILVGPKKNQARICESLESGAGGAYTQSISPEHGRKRGGGKGLQVIQHAILRR